MNNADLIERFEDDLRQLIQKMHKDGIPYETIGFVLSEVIKNLKLMAYCEKWLAECTPVKGLVVKSD